MIELVPICTLLVIAVTCVVSLMAFNNSEIERKYIFWPELILAGKEYYRLVSSAFLHANFRHLLFNMYSLYAFGSAIERVFGWRQFLVIYLSSVIGGSLLSLWIHRHHDYRAYGASGGVCGVIYSYIFLFPDGNIYFFLPIGIPAWLYAIVYMLFSIYALKARRDNVGHDAHLGGAIIGLLVTTALHPIIVQQSPKLFAVILAISIVLFIYLAINPLLLPMSSLGDFVPSFRRNSAKRSASTSSRTANRRVDELLEKISQSGLHSLSDEERAFLKSTSQKFQNRAERKSRESDLAI